MCDAAIKSIMLQSVAEQFGDKMELRYPKNYESNDEIEAIQGDCKPALTAVKSLNVTKAIMALPHLDTRLQKLRELVLRRLVRFIHVPGDYNPADLFTKLVTKIVWDKLVPLILNLKDDHGFLPRREGSSDER